jgi:catechol 2,3-dioxygenase-like lactoylglutathione lyase family enzyme
LDYAPDGKTLVRQIALGGALLSIHQASNGLELVARQPTVGGADICLHWSGSIESAADLLRTHGIAIIDGPSRRRTADGLPALSIYFRDPEGNLLELMAAEDEARVGAPT